MSALQTVTPPFRIVQADQVTPQPWRNGGGRTRELLVWPGSADWRLRISRADIDADGPFSAFADVQRWFAVLQGAGVQLHLPQGSRTLHAGDAPLAFDGADAPHCTLMDGPTLDLNLMVRKGSGAMQSVQAGAPWSSAFAVRAVYTCIAGEWSDGGHTVALGTHTLLWSATSHDAPWTFTPLDSGLPLLAWWMGCTPQAGA